jgi:serine/threonine protein kinase
LQGGLADPIGGPAIGCAYEFEVTSHSETSGVEAVLIAAPIRCRLAKREDLHGDAQDEAEALPTKEPAVMKQVDSWQGSTSLANAEDELIGKTLNNTYSVERILGEGAMGRVYQARHTRIAQKLVAVKVLRPEHLRNAEVLARFQREAETAASISHPNVVAVYDVDRTLRGMSYLVSEYLEGLDLGQYLKGRNQVGLATAVHIARQLCEGLGAAHRCGVIHRDLKPSNIFLVGDFAAGVPELPFVKILDFGLSKFMDAPNGGQLVTETGIVMGTPAFMPPEQAQGRQADLRADIYGVGALLYRCLTGRLPFDEATPQATVLAVIGTEPVRPRALVPSIPQYAELVIQRAMAKLPEARYPDMTSLLDALEPLVEKPDIRSESSSLRLLPRASFDTPVEQARIARATLVVFLSLAFVLLLGTVAMAVAGIDRAAGWSLSRRELGLALVCGMAVAITPTLLAVVRIRRLVWQDTNRVVILLTRVRAVVLTAMAICGLPWFGARVFDAVVPRLMGEPIRANQASVQSGSGASRTNAPPPAATAEPESAAPSTSSASVAPTRGPDSILPSKDTLASKAELHAASGRGEAAWAPLAERYPTDARVLRALVLASASRSAGLGDAMIVARRLFQASPEEAKSADMQYLVQRAAETPGRAAELAWTILAEDMGTNGPDVLYRLALTKPRVAERANQLLSDAAVRMRASPALAIAHDLRSASSCAARLPLLDRAIEVGDARALGVLVGLSTGTTHGCGKNKRKPCWPACPEQAERFRGAIKRLSLRLKNADK